jgi:hypothetical protein
MISRMTNLDPAARATIDEILASLVVMGCFHYEEKLIVV